MRSVQKRRLPFANTAGIVLAAVLLLGSGCSTSPTEVRDDTAARSVASAAAPPPNVAGTAATKGFVRRSGTRLTVDGTPFRFVGYNLPCANPFQMTPGELAHYLDVVREDSSANVIRVWFFQTNGGPANWEPFDRVIEAVRTKGMRIVATLTNEWNAGCDAGDGAEKTVDWYERGYRAPDTGHALAYRDFATQVAAHYANEPAIAMWQLVNEAQANTKEATGRLVCDAERAEKALRAFADDVAQALKAVDANHLVDLGTIGGNQCGSAGSTAYQFVHDGAVDVCEYHDYGHSSVALPSGPDELTQRIRDCATLPHGAKPLFVGESGIQGNVQPDGGPPACDPWPRCSPASLTTETVTRRATFFAAKMKAAASAGVAGYLLWVKSPFYSPSGDVYAIGDGDPTESAMRQASTADFAIAH